MKSILLLGSICIGACEESGGAGDADSDVDTDADSDSSTGSGSESDEDTDCGSYTYTASEPPETFSGALLDGGGGWELPMTCVIGSFETADSLTGGSLSDRALLVEAWPADYYFDAQVLEAYIGAICDTNRDCVLDAEDQAGGWHGDPPALTAAGSGIDVTIAPL